MKVSTRRNINFKTHPKLDPPVLSILGCLTETPLLLLLLAALLTAPSLLPASKEEKTFAPLALLLLLLLDAAALPVAFSEQLLEPPALSLSDDDELEGRRGNFDDDKISTLPKTDTPPIGF